MASWQSRAHYIFLVIGLGLLGGAAYWYEVEVRRPQSWPRVDADIVSSRVINPRGPDDYTPEIVLRYETGGRVRQNVIVPSWQSNSYDMVRNYVDRYPAGTRIPVAINPEDPDDARYEIGATFLNLLGPGILGSLGLIFTAVGVFARWRPRVAPQPPIAEPSVFHNADGLRRDADAAFARGVTVARRVGMLFVAIGMLIIGITVFLAMSGVGGGTAEWPSTEGTVVSSRVVSAGSTSSRNSGGSRTLFDAEVTFRYAIDGRTYESTTTSGSRTTSRDSASERAAFYAPGTAHLIYLMPGDPNIIRFDDSGSSESFWVMFGMIAMGIVFTGLGAAVWRFAGSGVARPRSLADIQREDDEADRFRPRM